MRAQVVIGAVVFAQMPILQGKLVRVFLRQESQLLILPVFRERLAIVLLR